MSQLNFEAIWSKIEALEGNQFLTKTGLPFTYSVNNSVVRTNRTVFNISKADFRLAYEQYPQPIPKPSVINKVVRGPACIWAILNDERIIR